MAKYRVLEKSFINGDIYEEGAIVEYDGEASGNLELVKENGNGGNGGGKGNAGGDGKQQ